MAATHADNERRITELERQVPLMKAIWDDLRYIELVASLKEEESNDWLQVSKRAKAALDKVAAL
jgi:hypothetical protein